MAAFHVCGDTRGLTTRELPSARATSIPEMLKECPMRGVGRHCFGVGNSRNVAVTSAAAARTLAGFWPKKAAVLVLGPEA